MESLHAEAPAGEQLSLFSSSSPTVNGDDLEVRTMQLVDWFNQEMEREGFDHAAQQQVLMRLQLQALVDQYLIKLPSQQRWQFVIRLIDTIQALEQHSSGF